MGHDQLFKEFLREFLREFLDLFFSEVASRLDLATLRFLDKEVFTDFPEGSVRQADLVAQVKTLEGEPKLILTHVEVQSGREPGFEARMFQYYALLWLRYRLPILPLVVYLTGGVRESLTGEEYRVRLLERDVLTFRYDAVVLSQRDAAEYAGQKNAVAAALAALMNRRGAGQPLTLRALMLQRVAESDWDDARKFLLLNLIETYFPLAPEEVEEFRRVLRQRGLREVIEMEVTWADKMKEEGRSAGVLEGKRETLLRQLSSKFGSIPQEVVTRIEAVESVDKLDSYLDRVLSATSLADVGLT